MAEKYRKRGLNLHRSTISRTLTKEEQTHKKGSKQFTELNIEKVKQFVLDNYDLYSYPYCFTLDEFGFYDNEVLNYTYSRKGCRAKVIQPGDKRTHYTVILCVQNLAG
jgi:hypothetical protein